MANIKQQVKRNLTNEKRRLQNASFKSSLKTAMKEVQVAVNNKDVEAAKVACAFACKKLDNISENSVFLKLDLVENIDFSYDDIDEVKNQPFSRKQLSYIYTYGNDVNDSKMEL